VERATVKRLIAQQKIRIPTLPTILTRINVLLQDPGAGVRDFGDVMDVDLHLVCERVGEFSPEVAFGFGVVVFGRDEIDVENAGGVLHELCGVESPCVVEGEREA